MQSCPEPGLAILTMGKRDVSFDLELPMPVKRYRAGRRTRRRSLRRRLEDHRP